MSKNTPHKKKSTQTDKPSQKIIVNIRGVDKSFWTKVRVYAAKHNVTIPQALEMLCMGQL